MENNCGAWFQHHALDLKSPDLNTLTSPSILRQPNIGPSCIKGGSSAFPTGEIFCRPFGIPRIRDNQTNQPHGWFYSPPPFHQSFCPLPNSTQKKDFSLNPVANQQETMTSKGKRFIVFDRSGDQTTVVYSCGIKTPVPCLTSLGPNISSARDVSKIELELGRDTVQYAGPILTNTVSGDSQRDDLGTEMHEDTDEINALLYSSDEDEYPEDDEEASTGHSPCTFTVNDERQLFEDIEEEVASSVCPAKRMKLMDGSYNLPSLHDTASSNKYRKCFDYEDDAESSCAEGEGQRSRKEKIRETVAILQNILPRVKGKDAIMILDEAIAYLKSLKHKALDLGVEIV